MAEITTTSYQKTLWAEDVGITAERLNNIETQFEKAVGFAQQEVAKVTPEGKYAEIGDFEWHITSPDAHANHVRGTMKITVSTTAPTSVQEGDIWIQVD